MPRGARRWLFRIVLLLGVLVVIEGISFALLHGIVGADTQWRLQAVSRNGGDDDATFARRVRAVDPGEVIHPYVGYVVEPEQEPAGGAAKVKRQTPDLFELGFTGPLVRQRDPGTVVMGVFGGSAAAYFYNAGGPARLFERLKTLPAFAGKRLVLLSTAQGGFKQPQSLLSLAYLLSLGAKLDVLLLLDGFNEVALAPAENTPQGVFPFFPRSWGRRVSDLSLATEGRALIGEITYLNRLRTERARWLRASPLGHSQTGQILWLLADRNLAGRLATLRADLAGPGVKDQLDYLARGPHWPVASRAALLRDLAAVWKEGSFQMNALCTAYGIRFYHFLQPNQYVAGSKPMGPEERVLALNPKNPYSRFAAAGYPLLRAVGSELRAAGVPFHDLTLAFQDVSEPLYVDDCCHVGARGNEILADAMAEAILRDEAH